MLFVIMCGLYLFIYNRERLYKFLAIVVVPIVIYLALRTHALGVMINPRITQIDSLSIWGRLSTLPAIIQWYIVTFFFPVHLAHAYYWTVPKPTLFGFFVPLLVDCAFATGLVFVGILVKRQLTKAYYLTYVFFAVWYTLGIVLLSQIIPLDLTISPSWFYFPSIGLLGMVGVATMLIPRRLPKYLPVAFAVVVIALLGTRTAIRGFDWANDATLASRDVKLSPEDYNAQFEIARAYAVQSKFAQARPYAEKAEAIYPTYQNAELLADICLWNGSVRTNQQAINTELKRFPRDSTLWLDLAIVDENNGYLAEAKAAITHAYNLSHTHAMQSYYTQIMQGQQINVSPGG